MNVQRPLRAILILAIGSLLIGATALDAATPRKMNGTWSSLVEVPANPLLGNPEPVLLPELDTFSTAGTVVTSAGNAVLPLQLDGQTQFVAVGIGQGNWKYRAGKYSMTQYRFLSDVSTGEPFGYLKIIAEWTLSDKNYGTGAYLVELLDVEMQPIMLGTSPAQVAGDFELWRLPIEQLPEPVP